MGHLELISSKNKNKCCSISCASVGHIISWEMKNKTKLQTDHTVIDEIFDPLRPGSKLWRVQKYPPYYLEVPVLKFCQMLLSFEIITIYVSVAEGGIPFPSKCLS